MLPAQAKTMVAALKKPLFQTPGFTFAVIFAMALTSVTRPCQHHNNSRRQNQAGKATQEQFIRQNNAPFLHALFENANERLKFHEYGQDHFLPDDKSMSPDISNKLLFSELLRVRQSDQ